MKRLAKRFTPRSASRQISVILVIAIVLSNLMVIGVWTWVDPPGIMPGPVRALDAEIAATARMVDTAPDAGRAAVIAATAEIGLAVTPLSELPMPAEPDSWTARMLGEKLTRHGLAGEVGMAGSPSGDPAGLILLLRLENGRAYSVAVNGERVVAARPSLLLRSTSALLLIGLPLLLVPCWAASRITHPLSQLGRSAETIGLSGDGPTLPETGTTEVRQMAQAINRLVNRLRQDMAERTRIMAGISHDLRTPLTRLHLRVDAMEDEALRPRLMRDVVVMEDLVTASLALLETELRSEKLERLDVAALAATVCDSFADAGHDVAYKGPLRCAISGQPRGLERALSNLAENAVKYAGAARVRLDVSEDEIRLAVEDSGPGIPEADLPYVTEAFRRADDATSGNGLGLAIVAGVARAHGAQLRLANLLPRGLRVELVLHAS